MNLATPEECTVLCTLLAKLCDERSDIEARRAAMERVGLDSPDVDAKDSEQLQRLDSVIAQLRGLLETLCCDCDNCKQYADGGASPGLSPS